MSRFAAGESSWIDRLGGLRNAVRQELIGRQLAAHVHGGTVLDVGCGQGTQAIKLAARGCDVVGVDPSQELLSRLHADAAAAGVPITTHFAVLDDLASVIAQQRFDLVCAHGLLMYLADPKRAVATLAGRVADGGQLSITFRNGGALAFRPGMRRQWQAALASFDALDYVNELGVPAAAQRLEDVIAMVSEVGLQVTAWYGVRLFTDPAEPTEVVPPAEFEALLAAEEEACRRDPYRQLASQIHLVARRNA